MLLHESDKTLAIAVALSEQESAFNKMRRARTMRNEIQHSCMLAQLERQAVSGLQSRATDNEVQIRCGRLPLG